MFDKANEAATSASDRPKPAQLKDHLLIVRVIEHRNDNPMGVTRTSKNAETGAEITTAADSVIADVVDLDSEGQPVYYDYVFLQSKLIQHFKTNVGMTLIGVIGQHPDQGERRGAYYFTDRWSVPREKAVAEAWAQNHPEFFASQAPGNVDRVSNAPVQTQANVFQTQHEDNGKMTTLEAMRAAAAANTQADEGIPF